MGRKLVMGLLVICVVLLGLWWVDHTRQAGKILPVYSGPAEGLKHTIVAPTLDEPLAAGKNVVWAAALQLAWDELREAAGGVPLRVTKGQELADRLNAAPFDRKLLPEGSWLAWAGPSTPERDAAFAEQLASRGIALDTELAIAGGALVAEVPFTYAYEKNPTKLLFTGSDSRPVLVECFGLKKREGNKCKSRQQHQPQLLYVTQGPRPDQVKEIMVDMDHESSPSQLLLACVEPGKTLAATVEHALDLVASAPDEPMPIPSHALLGVPEFSFELSASAPEFRSGYFLDPPLDEWSRSIQLADIRTRVSFTLNHRGAQLKSAAVILLAMSMSELVFDRPFLVLMRVRGEREPYFAMWVANAELMRKR